MDIAQILCDVLMPMIEMLLSFVNPFLAMLGLEPIVVTCEDLFPPTV